VAKLQAIINNIAYKLLVSTHAIITNKNNNYDKTYQTQRLHESLDSIV
jgi:hypothetical protein